MANSYDLTEDNRGFDPTAVRAVNTELAAMRNMLWATYVQAEKSMDRELSHRARELFNYCQSELGW